MQTPNLTSQNIDKIAALFPNCITEMLDEEKSTPDHKVYKHGINFELLKQMLSPDVVDGDEAYEFTWVDLSISMLIIALFDPTEEEKVEADAKDKGFSYVHMDGNIGCMVNGAGLAMATMDMIKLYGGQPANFLDIGGSSNPVKVIEAMKLLLQDEKVKVVLINIFGGITRCDDVAMGLLQAFEQINSNVPVIVRLTGTNEHIGRELLRNYSRFQIATTMKEAALMALKA